MMEECIIIGGGVAGLSAAIRLTELGIQPLVIEAGKYPGHRICGEFFSPEILPILDQWEIPLDSTIRKCRFIIRDKEVYFELPRAAGGASRYNFDMKLLEKAKRQGAKILTESACMGLRKPQKPGEHFIVELADGTAFKSKRLMIGTGRLPKMTQSMEQSPMYAGFKAHFQGIEENDTLEMHCFEGGYLGVSPVAPGLINIACIARLDRIEKMETFMQMLLQLKGMERFRTRLDHSHMVFEKWLSGKVPEFGIRKNPSWPDVYWIGDAAGSIPPVCGDGLGIALTTGIMAAEYMAARDSESFRKDWAKRYQSRFFWGKCLHEVVLRPSLCSLAHTFCRLVPTLPAQLFRLTREN